MVEEEEEEENGEKKWTKKEKIMETRERGASNFAVV